MQNTAVHTSKCGQNEHSFLLGFCLQRIDKNTRGNPVRASLMVTLPPARVKKKALYF